MGREGGAPRIQLDPRCRSRSLSHFLLSIFCQRLQNGNPSHSIQATSRESAGEAAVGGPETPESRTSPKRTESIISNARADRKFACQVDVP